MDMTKIHCITCMRLSKISFSLFNLLYGIVLTKLEKRKENLVDIWLGVDFKTKYQKPES